MACRQRHSAESKSKLMRRHLKEKKLEMTNWFLAKVDDLYCPPACDWGSRVSGLVFRKFIVHSELILGQNNHATYTGVHEYIHKKEKRLKRE